MASNIFLDANIVLDFTLQRDIEYTNATEIMQHVIDGRLHACITPIIVHIAGYFLKKSHGIDIAKKLLLSFLTDIKTIDVPFIVVQQALKSDMPDVEDSLQHYAALHHNLDYFISRDKPLKKFALSPLPIIHPKEFIEHFLS